MDLRSASLLQLSQELGRFNYDLLGKFRCPTCLNDFSIESREVSEEHIIPASVGGSLTTFLCKDCNSFLVRSKLNGLESGSV